MESAEHALSLLVIWSRIVVEAAGVLTIGVGFVISLKWLLRFVLRHELKDYETLRTTLARYLALALEFQLAADILSTAIAPTWDSLGKLAATATIRTALNYFLSRELSEPTHEGRTKDPTEG